MKGLLIFIVGLSVQPLVLADWRVDTRVDPITDEVKTTAIVQNELGHTFSIYRFSGDGSVWGNFALSERTFDQLNWKKPPIYRVDNNEPVDLANLKLIQEFSERIGIETMQLYEWEPKWVNFRIWNGKEAEGVEDLAQFMKGEKVVFRYYLVTGGFKDTSFSLKGAATAISEAIGISPQIDPSALQKSEEFNKAYANEFKKCEANMATFDSCFSHLRDCRKQADNDVDKLKSCMQ